jgi:putative membrane protein
MLVRTVGLRISFLSSLCLCAGSALATDAASTSSSASSGTPPDPKAFVTLASQENMAEVQLGELAMRNTRNPNVHRFAQRMINDHGKANTELVGIAQQENLIVAKQLDPERTALVQDLSSKNGPEFDAAYAKTMEDAHAKAISLFKRATKTSDPQISQFARQTLPTLEEHKRMADKLNPNNK